MRNYPTLKTHIIIALAVVSVAATLWARVEDDELVISSWGSIGYNYDFGWTSSSSPESYFESGTFLVGEGNYNPNYNSGAHGTLAVGTYLVTYSTNSVVIGSWNANTGGDEQFIIGNGSPSAPSNSFEVYKDGTIKMAKQGDLSMGQFNY